MIREINRAASRVQAKKTQALLGLENEGRAFAILRYRGLVWEVELMEITPELAAAWLEKNTRNRPASDHSVKKIARQLTNGHWVANGQTIVFTEDGNLSDGQHRLKACVLSGISFISLVARGVPPDAFETTDQGISRTKGHTLAVHGVKNYNTVAAIADLYFKHLKGRADYNHAEPSSTEVMGFYWSNRDVDGAAHVAVQKDLREIVAPKPAGFCYMLFYRQNPSLAVQFFTKLRTGLGLAKGDPAYTLREKLLKMRSDKTMTPEADAIVALFFKAWNLAKRGVKCPRLSYVPFDKKTGIGEPFPTID